MLFLILWLWGQTLRVWLTCETESQDRGVQVLLEPSLFFTDPGEPAVCSGFHGWWGAEALGSRPSVPAMESW